MVDKLFALDPTKHSYPRIVNIHRKVEPRNESDFIEMDLTIVTRDISILGHSKRKNGQEEFWARMKDGQNIYFESIDEINLLWAAMDEYYKSAIDT